MGVRKEKKKKSSQVQILHRTELSEANLRGTVRSLTYFEHTDFYWSGAHTFLLMSFICGESQAQHSSIQFIKALSEEAAA